MHILDVAQYIGGEEICKKQHIVREMVMREHVPEPQAIVHVCCSIGLVVVDVIIGGNIVFSLVSE